MLFQRGWAIFESRSGCRYFACWNSVAKNGRQLVWDNPYRILWLRDGPNYKHFRLFGKCRLMSKTDIFVSTQPGQMLGMADLVQEMAELFQHCFIGSDAGIFVSLCGDSWELLFCFSWWYKWIKCFLPGFEWKKCLLVWQACSRLAGLVGQALWQ